MTSYCISEESVPLGLTCLLVAVGQPDFGERWDGPRLGAVQGGLGLAVDVEVGV